MIVQNENGISARLKAERKAIPVIMPGSAIGKITKSEMVSRPKNLDLETAAAQSVPRTSAITVEIDATLTDNPNASQTSDLPQVTANHFKVSPGGGH